jgi:serine/threonine protein kinase
MNKIQNFWNVFKKKKKLNSNPNPKMESLKPLKQFIDIIDNIYDKMIEPCELASLSKIFYANATNNDLLIVENLLKRFNGNLYYPFNDQVYSPIGETQDLIGSSKTKTITDGDYVFKYTTMNSKTMINEIIYGGYLTYINPELFCGSIQYNFQLKCNVIQNEGLIDAFEVYHMQVDLERSRKIVHSMINALVYLHKLGFLHNDVKLENILVDLGSSRIKFIDFENVMLIKNTPNNKDIVGTYQYCCPLLYYQEEYLRISKSQWTDVYALCNSILIFLFNTSVVLIEDEIDLTNYGIEREYNQRVACVKNINFIQYELKQLFIEIFEMNVEKLDFKYGSAEIFLETLFYYI